MRQARVRASPEMAPPERGDEHCYLRDGKSYGTENRSDLHDPRQRAFMDSVRRHSAITANVLTCNPYTRQGFGKQANPHGFWQ
jgi:hypothetical protein